MDILKSDKIASNQVSQWRKATCRSEVLQALSGIKQRDSEEAIPDPLSLWFPSVYEVRTRGPLVNNDWKLWSCQFVCQGQVTCTGLCVHMYGTLLCCSTHS